MNNEERIRYEKMRYAINVSSEIPLFSPNIGIRRKSLDKSSPGYAELTSIVKDVFEKFSPNFCVEEIYHYLQKIDLDLSVVENVDKLGSIISKIPLDHTKWLDTSINSSWGDWVQVIYNRNTNTREYFNYKPEYIKVYACLRNEIAQDIYVDSLSYLLQHVDESFAAKISTCTRSDQMCYWLSARDFHCLQSYFQPYNDEMTKSLPFVAYMGNFGISRDFPGTDHSHNGTQARIISDYLKSKSNKADIDIEDMYNSYISKWNADIYEEGLYSGFKVNSVLSFIVINDTLDVLLNKCDVSNESLLMSGDKRLWSILSESRCWADLNDNWALY